MLFLLQLLLLLPGSPLPDPAERHALLRSWSEPVVRSWEAQEGTDFLTYDIHLAVIPDSCSVSGMVSMSLLVEQALDSLVIDLSTTLVVDSVFLAGEPKSFAHADDRIHIPLRPPATPGDTLCVEISYHGNPYPEGFGSFICTERDGTPQFWTLSQTDFAHTWWPCHDSPNDKALVTMSVTVPYPPESFFVASNGILEDVQYRDGWTTYFWNELYPISPYLVSLAGTNYITVHAGLRSLSGDSIPVEYYIYPELQQEASEDFSKTPEMIAAFEERYGPYPFQGEKYAMALVRRGGAMEHQTVTSYGDTHIRGDHHFDWIVAHELAHQWWGDWVTCRSWGHIWLNEGFASFSEAVWFESIGGEEAYREYMQGQDYLRTSGHEFPGTVLNPEYTFSITVYDKGAWIVHMLRRLVGEEIFWEALLDYGQRHAHGTAVTEDLLSVFEEHTASDLQWFFDQWLVREGRPHLELSWERVETYAGDSVIATIAQVQDDLPYRLPLDLLFKCFSGDSLVAVEVSDEVETFRFFFPFRINTWEVDPRESVLLWIDSGPGDPEESYPPLTIYAPRPNPSSDKVAIGFDLPEQTWAQLKVFDLLGRSVWSDQQRMLPAGWSTLEWPGIQANGRRTPSGFYLIRATAGEKHRFSPVILLN